MASEVLSTVRAMLWVFDLHWRWVLAVMTATTSGNKTGKMCSLRVCLLH